jgi:hypothetical protein
MSTMVTLPLSGSTSGRPIKVGATATPGTLIHTAQATSQDRLFLTATNTTASPITVTIEKGGVSVPDDLVVDAFEVPGGGFPWEFPPMQITGGLVIRAFAGTTNVILIDGFVNRWAG